MLRKFAVVFIGVLFFGGSVFAQGKTGMRRADPSSTALGVAPWSDHCRAGLKNAVPFASATSATTQLVAAVTGANIYVCGFDINQAGGTADTAKFEYGTGTACATGPQALTGVFTGNTSAGAMTNVHVTDEGFTQFTTNTAGVPVPSQELCIVTTGTPVQGGYLVYVQE